VLIFSADISGGLKLAYSWSHRLFEAWLENGWL